MSAEIHRGPFSMKLSRGAPRLTNWPAASRRLVTTPSAGAMTVVLLRSSCACCERGQRLPHLRVVVAGRAEVAPGALDFGLASRQRRLRVLSMSARARMALVSRQRTLVDQVDHDPAELAAGCEIDALLLQRGLRHVDLDRRDVGGLEGDGEVGLGRAQRDLERLADRCGTAPALPDRAVVGHADLRRPGR